MNGSMIVLLALAACASASVAPLTLVGPAGLVNPGVLQAGLIQPGLVHPGLINGGLVHPGLINGGLVHPGLVNGGLVHPGLVNGGLVHPGLVSPWGHGLVVPAVAAPVVKPGYVAATRGSLHVAPLPGNTPYASHHLNLAPAPGTH